jgi:hypothetical protein
VGEPGIGNTINGVTLGDGVMPGMKSGVEETERRETRGGSTGSPDWGVGGVGAPHSAGLVVLAQAVNKLTIIVIWKRRWSLCISRGGLYQQHIRVSFVYRLYKSVAMIV